MWRILERYDVPKTCRKLPQAVVKKYEVWKGLVFRHGPDVLRQFPGFHDEKLKGERSGQRSSRLSIKHRVIYEVQRTTVTVYVEEINVHEY